MSPAVFRRSIVATCVAGLVSTTALVAAAAPANAESVIKTTPTDSIATWGLAGSYTPSTKATRYIKFQVSFTGTAVSNTVSYSPYDQQYHSPSFTVVSSKVKSPYKPTIVTPSAASMKPNTKITYQLRLNPLHSPGKYTIKIPVTKRVYANSKFTYSTLWATRTVVINANTGYSKANTTLSGSGKFSKSSRWSVTVRAKEYQAGAKVGLYYKAKGAKKYTKIGATKLDSKGRKTFKLGKGKIRKAGQIYAAIGKVTYAASYKTQVFRVRKA